MRQLPIIIPLLLFSLCTRPPLATPDWVEESVSNSIFWYGVGTGESRQSAREAAFNEIASQISVEISSSFTRVITEQNYNPVEYTNSIINARLTASLPEIEILKTQQVESLFYVQARLSKDRYFSLVDSKRQAAIQKALDLLDLSRQDFSKNTFVLLTDALKQIVDYMDEDLRVIYPPDSGNEINLYSYINGKILEYFNQIAVKPESNAVDVIAGLPIKNGLTLTCFDQVTGNPLQGIPLIANDVNTVSDYSFMSIADGSARFAPDVIRESGVHIYHISVDSDELIPAVLGRVGIPSIAQADISVAVRGLKIQFVSEELNLGHESSNPYVEPAIKKYFKEQFNAVFTDETEADIVMNTRVSCTRRNPQPSEYYGQLVYQASADGTLTIIDPDSRRELLQRSINNVAGISYNSFDDAGKDALKKLSEKIYDEILPQIAETLSH